MTFTPSAEYKGAHSSRAVIDAKYALSASTCAWTGIAGKEIQVRCTHVRCEAVPADYL